MNRSHQGLAQGDALRDGGEREIAVVPDFGARRLMHEDHRVRHRAMQQADGHAAVRRMVHAPLPFDDQDFALAALVTQPLGGSVDVVAEHVVDGDAAALNHDPGLARRGPVAVPSARPQRLGKLQCCEHFSDAAIRADDRHAPLFQSAQQILRDAQIRRRNAHVLDPHIARFRSGGKFRIVAQNVMQAVDNIQSGANRIEHNRAPRLGQFPAHRRDPDHELIGAKFEAFFDGRNDWNVGADGNERVQRTVALRGDGIEHADDFIGTIAHETRRGFRGEDAKLTLGEDHHSALSTH